MNILLIDTDYRMPNLALMKLSAYHKNQGDQVFFDEICQPDRVYISCVFDWNKDKALSIAKKFSDKAQVLIGGSGVSLVNNLQYEIEHTCPDYDLYKERGKRYFGNLLKLNCQFNGSIAIGFTSRGCIRDCPFCIVPKKEGPISDNAFVTEFLSDKKKVRLLDNNFLASPKWRENLAYINDHNIEVCFDQGLDIRLINKENARILAETKYRNRNFRWKCLYFAWDNPKDESIIRRGIKTLVNAGIHPNSLQFYMLVGFNTTFYQDLYRFNVLRELDVDPFVMIFNRKKTLILRAFARWVNRRQYKSCDFSQYDPSFKLLKPKDKKPNRQFQRLFDE